MRTGAARRGFYAALLIQAVTLLIMGLNPPLAMMFLVRALQGVLGAFVFVGGASLAFRQFGYSYPAEGTAAALKFI